MIHREDGLGNDFGEDVTRSRERTRQEIEQQIELNSQQSQVTGKPFVHSDGHGAYVDLPKQADAEQEALQERIKQELQRGDLQHGPTSTRDREIRRVSALEIPSLKKRSEMWELVKGEN